MKRYRSPKLLAARRVTDADSQPVLTVYFALDGDEQSYIDARADEDYFPTVDASVFPGRSGTDDDAVPPVLGLSCGGHSDPGVAVEPQKLGDETSWRVPCVAEGGSEAPSDAANVDDAPSCGVVGAPSSTVAGSPVLMQANADASEVWSAVASAPVRGFRWVDAVDLHEPVVSSVVDGGPKLPGKGRNKITPPYGASAGGPTGDRKSLSPRSRRKYVKLDIAGGTIRSSGTSPASSRRPPRACSSVAGFSPTKMPYCSWKPPDRVARLPQPNLSGCHVKKVHN